MKQIIEHTPSKVRQPMVSFGQAGLANLGWLLGIAVTVVLLIGGAAFWFMAQDPTGERRFVPVAEWESTELTRWQGTLRCSELADHPAFERAQEITVADNVIAFESGNTRAFLEAVRNGVVPAEVDKRFEWWRGNVNSGFVRLQGWYKRGPSTVKTVSMTGTLDAGGLRLEGERGPRRCVFEARPA